MPLPCHRHPPAAFRRRSFSAMMKTTDSKELPVALTQTPPETTAIAGVAVIARIRRVLIVSVIAALAYTSVMAGTAGYCPGGSDGSGGFIDASGQAGDQALMCVKLELRPSILIYIGIGLIVLLAIGRVMKAPDELVALRILDRAAIAVGTLAVVAAVVSVVWLRMIPIEEFQGRILVSLQPIPLRGHQRRHHAVERVPSLRSSSSTAPPALAARTPPRPAR